MPRWKKYSLIAVASIFSILLLSMVVVPWQIKKQGSAWFAENTSRQLTIEKAFFNPFALTVEVKGVTLTEQQSTKTFVSLDRLMLSASSRSLIDMAIILDRVELDAPYVNIELLGKQDFNFSDFTRLGDDKPQPIEEEPVEPLLFSFNNIILNAGQVDFTDWTLPDKVQHQIRELDLAVPFVGNVPYLTDEYVEPHLRLLLNGSELLAKGQLKPFDESLETSLSFSLTEIDLSFYATRSPVPLPVELKSGVLDSQMDLTYRISDSKEPQLLISGELALSDIDVREPTGDNLFLLPTLILELDQADVLDQSFDLHSLEIYEPQLFVKRDQEGQFNLVKLFTDKNAPGEEPVAVEQSEPIKQPLLNVTQLLLVDGSVHLQDDYPLGGFQETLQGINLQLDNLSTHPDQLTELAFKLQTARELTFSLKGQFGLNPLNGNIDLALNGFLLKPHYPYLSDVLTQPLEGTLNLASNIQFGPEISLKLEQLQGTLQQLTTPFTKKDRFTLKDLRISDGSFDLEKQLLRIGSIKLIDGELVASRSADGKLSPLALMREKDTQNAPAETTAPVTVELPWQKQAAKIDAADFKLQLDSFALENFNLKFTDASLDRKPQLKVAQLNIGLENLAYPESQQSPFKIDARLGKKGTVALSGTLAHSPLRVESQTKIKALPLADFNDFLPENVNVSLRDGKLYTSLAVKLDEQPEEMTGSFAGDITIGDLNLRDPLDDGELLTWENLSLVGINGEIAPFKLGIKEVVLSNYLAKIQIDSEGRVNLANVTAAEEADQENSAETEPQTETEPEPGEVATEEAPTDTGPSPDIRIDALTLQGGTVSFIDRSLPNAFSTTMYKLGGRVTGMASDAQMQADVDLRGELENHSPLTISGKLNPLSKDLYADLTIRFKDIDLTPLTPYSGTYVGYVIDKGKLYLDLSYHIENRKLSAENKIMVDQFTFGDPVESDKATSLPVGLAIALLKDNNGEIHLDVPISGDLNDPSFSIMGTVFTVVKNLLVKAATSPFSLLTSMLGDGGEDFTSLTFDSGIARLDEKQLEMLAKLATMLAERPSLTLEISAFADQDKDPEGYRKDQLLQKMITAKWFDLKEDEKAPESRELVSISPEDYPKYLLRVYKEAEFPRPRNFVGMLKGLPDAEMEKLLLTDIRVGDVEMQTLAQARASLVRDGLIADNEEIKPRIFLKTVDIYQPPEKGPASRVEFNISAK